MTTFYVFLGFIIGILAVFFITHLRPLTELEIWQLAEKRRNRQIREYFIFSQVEFLPNPEFKKNMKADGRYYVINEKLFELPSIIAALLKYKKHEWIVVAFEKNRTIDLIWLNKGEDNRSVSLIPSLGKLSYQAHKENYTSVLKFHNHPNSNPGLYDCTKPSEQDLRSARIFATAYNDYGVNLVEFVCERGRHYEYFLSPAHKFLPLNDFIIAVRSRNGLRSLQNLSLHMERIFRRKIRFSS